MFHISIILHHAVFVLGINKQNVSIYSLDIVIMYFDVHEVFDCLYVFVCLIAIFLPCFWKCCLHHYVLKYLRCTNLAEMEENRSRVRLKVCPFLKLHQRVKGLTATA